MKLDVLILAGGMGTRLQSQFPTIPKPLAPVNGTPFLHLLLTYWAKSPVQRFVISVGHMAEQIIQSVGHSFAGIPVHYVKENFPLGTGGAVLQAMQEAKLSSPFLLLNGDTFFPVDLTALMNREESYVMALRSVTDTTRFGSVTCDASGKVQQMKSATPGAGLINGGVALVRQLTYATDSFPLSLENDIIPALLKSGETIGSVIQNVPFVDMGTPEGHQAACELLSGELT